MANLLAESFISVSSGQSYPNEFKRYNRTCEVVNNDLFDLTIFFTDSKVDLGYIYNEQKRFTKYVARRAEIIRSHSEPSNWKYCYRSLFVIFYVYLSSRIWQHHSDRLVSFILFILTLYIPDA